MSELTDPVLDGLGSAQRLCNRVIQTTSADSVYQGRDFSERFP